MARQAATAGLPRTDCAIGYKTTVLELAVLVTALDDGGYCLRSEIRAYKTSQSMFLGLIPSSPKELMG
jgi:hypothetical protein